MRGQNTPDLETALKSLPDKPRVVVLTGSGISAESGLETFRDKDGIWSRYSIEDVATPGAFIRNPELVHSFYNMRRRALLADTVKPNAAHHALVRLERRAQNRFLLVTQNVDDLHERAGSENLIHMHGEILKSLCGNCHDVRDSHSDLDIGMACAACGRAGGLRPAVVWFGEMPLAMGLIEKALARCDLFLSIGTSGHVYPAAGFANIAGAGGALTCEINLEPSDNAFAFRYGLYGPASHKVPEFVDRLLNMGF